tara:strand:+ start:117 stop:2228 length:2112 start_codon:yes stop_codon:yes gene_type:complete
MINPNASGIMSIAQDMNENTKSVQQGTNLLKRMGFKMSPKLIAMMKDMDLIKSKEVAQVNATNATVKDDVNKAVDEIMVSENQLDPGFPREGRGGEMPTRGNILAEARGNAAQDVIRRMDGGLMNLSPQARMNQGLMQFYPPVQRMANGGNLTLGQRNNNFGNIRTNPSNNWLGKISDPENLSGYEQFANPLFGLRALDILLGNYGSKNNIKTTRGLVERFAPTEDNPEEEGFIATSKYAEAIANKLGVGIDDEIDLTNQETRDAIIPTITNIESRQDVSVDDINKARNLTEEDESALINSALVGRPPESQEGMSPEENNAINLINQVTAIKTVDPTNTQEFLSLGKNPKDQELVEFEPRVDRAIKNQTRDDQALLNSKTSRYESLIARKAKVDAGETSPFGRGVLGDPTEEDIAEAKKAMEDQKIILTQKQRSIAERMYANKDKSILDPFKAGPKKTDLEKRKEDQAAKKEAETRFPPTPDELLDKRLDEVEKLEPKEFTEDKSVQTAPVLLEAENEISKTEGQDPEQQQKSIDGILAKLKKIPADEVIAFIAGMIDSPTVTAGVKAGLTNALNTRLANKKLDATIAQNQMTNLYREASLLQGRMGEPMTKGQFTEFFETKYPELKEAGGWDKMKKRYETAAKNGSKADKLLYENIKGMNQQKAFDYFWETFQDQYGYLLAPGAYGGSGAIPQFNEKGEIVV